MKTKENGQIIVILAVALVAVLGITALAVDGSMIYRERREDQTMADSISLSAATTASASTTCATARAQALAQAISYASTQEGLTLANDSSSPNRVEATCSADNTKLDIKVTVTSNPTTTFAKMVARNQLTTSVASTARVTVGVSTAYANGNGLWTTGSTCDANGGIWLSGTAKILITGGGAYSASCISVASSPSGVISDSSIYYSGKTGTGVTTTTIGTQTVYLGTSATSGSNGIMVATWQKSFALTNPSLAWPSYEYQVKTGPIANTLIAQAEWPIYSATIPTLTAPTAMVTQSCSGLTDYGTPADTSTSYSQGLYTSISVAPWAGDTTFGAGVYCIKPGGSVTLSQKNVTANNTIFYFQGAGTFKMTGGIGTVTMNNSSIYLTNGNFDIDQGTFKAANITIYIKQGSFYLRNGAYGSTMTAPNCSDATCGVGPSIKGMLLYMDPANTGTFNVLNGNGTHTLTGTIFAPNALATFDGGTAAKTNDFQLIAKRIEMSGSATLTMDTNNGDLFTTNSAASVELLK